MPSTWPVWKQTVRAPATDQQAGDAGDDAPQERRLGRDQACDHDDQTDDQTDEGDEGAPPMATSDVDTRNEPRIIV